MSKASGKGVGHIEEQKLKLEKKGKLAVGYIMTTILPYMVV